MFGEEFPRGGWPQLGLRLWQAGAATIACDRSRGAAGKCQTMGALCESPRQSCLGFHIFDGIDGVR
jgi:hypothetical protein